MLTGALRRKGGRGFFVLRHHRGVRLFCNLPAEVPFSEESIRTLHRCEDAWVIDKPSGVSMFADRQGGTSLWPILKKVLAKEGLQPLQVHRLDKGTSGVLLVALNSAAHSHYIKEFGADNIDSVYVARVAGRVDTGQGMLRGRIELPLHPGRKSRQRVAGPREAIVQKGNAWRLSVPPEPEGRASTTFFKILERPQAPVEDEESAGDVEGNAAGTGEVGDPKQEKKERKKQRKQELKEKRQQKKQKASAKKTIKEKPGLLSSLLALKPKPGITHQLRVHCAWIGHQILGDPLYGPKDNIKAAPRMALHHHQFTISSHRVMKPDLKVEAPLPALLQPTRRRAMKAVAKDAAPASDGADPEVAVADPDPGVGASGDAGCTDGPPADWSSSNGPA